VNWVRRVAQGWRRQRPPLLYFTLIDPGGAMKANANPYLMLGVRPFINCCSVRTMHGGSLMLPQVRDAMAEASRHFVNLDELMEAAGQRLAELTGAEWGIVTCGSAAAVALGTAACVAGNDPVKNAAPALHRRDGQPGHHSENPAFRL
jgi:hypothetical protein